MQMLVDTNLLIRYISGRATDEEKVEIMKWIESDPEHKKNFLMLRKVYDVSIWQTKESFNSTRFSIQKSKIRRKQFILNIVKIAAILIVVFFVGRYFFFSANQTMQVKMNTIRVPAGQHTELTLADGTQVWLNTNTVFTYPERFAEKQRVVDLKGEGYFKVTKNVSKPFIVKTTEYNIKVLGTEFNITAYPHVSHFEASLLEGSIELFKDGSTRDELVMKPDERVYLHNHKLVLGKIKDYDQFLWKDGIIVFNDETFRQMAHRLETYYDLEITIKNEDILNNRITGKFRASDGIEHILKVLQLDNKFQYKIEDKNKILIQ